MRKKETQEERDSRVFGNSGTKDGSRVKDSPMDDPEYRAQRRADQNRPLFNRIFQSKLASSRVKNMDGSYVGGDDYRWNPLKNKDIALGGYIKRGEEAEREKRNVARRTRPELHKVPNVRPNFKPIDTTPNRMPKVKFSPEAIKAQQKQEKYTNRDSNVDSTRPDAGRDTGGRRTTRKKGPYTRTTFESISLKLKIINENK